MKRFLSIIIIAFFGLIIASCGATRKVQTDINKESSEVEKESVSSKTEQTEQNTKTTTLSTENSKDSTITETIEITPLDNEKPAYFNDNGNIVNVTNAVFKKTKTFNNISKKKESKTDLNEYVKNKSDNQLSEKSNEKKDSKKKIKKIDSKKHVSAWNWLLLIIPIIIVCWALNKYKESIWFL
jgi:hypothetical protein